MANEINWTIAFDGEPEHAINSLRGCAALIGSLDTEIFSNNANIEEAIDLLSNIIHAATDTLETQLKL